MSEPVVAMREPIWRHGRSAVPGDDLPAETEDLVIGAGLTGMVTALLLARAGRRVTVLEATGVGAGTTGASSAKLSLLHGTRLSDLARYHRRDVLDAYVEANREGQAWLRRFCADHRVPIQSRTAITFAASPRSVPTLEREFELEQDLDLGSTWAGSWAAPFDVSAAIVLADQAQVDPLDVLEALTLQFRAHGGTLCVGDRMTGLRTSRDEVVVRTAAGSEIRADHVVLATGSPVLDRGLDFARHAAERSYIIALSGAEPPNGMFLSVDHPVVSVRDAPQRGLVLVGGHGHVTGRAGSERDHLDKLRAWAARAFPGATERAAWSAQDYSAFDGLPEAAVLPWSDGRVHVATGFGKWGLSNGVAAALTISADTLGERPWWAQRLDRALNLRSLPELVSLNVEVGGRMISSVPARVSGRRPICTHLGGVLCWNDAESTWDCPLHGSRFTADGAVIEGPAVDALAPVRH